MLTKEMLILGESENGEPFTKEELEKVLAQPLFTGCYTENMRYKKGRYLIKDHKFFFPLVMLFGGFRPNEIRQMTLDDIKMNNGILCYHVNREDGKTTKTKESIRPIPVHPMLWKELGLKDYVEQQKSEGKTHLFDSTYDYSGMMNENILVNAGVKRPNINLYSFRHTYAQHIRIFPDAMQQRLMGHSSKTMTGRYGGGLSPEEMQEFIEKFRVPLDWKKLTRKPKLPV